MREGANAASLGERPLLAAVDPQTRRQPSPGVAAYAAKSQVEARSPSSIPAKVATSAEATGALPISWQPARGRECRPEGITSCTIDSPGIHRQPNVVFRVRTVQRLRFG